MACARRTLYQATGRTIIILRVGIVTCVFHMRESHDNFLRVTKFPWEIRFDVCSHRDVYYFMSDVNWP